MFPAYYSGFADEAGGALDVQIKATQELGWSAIEMRNVEVPGFPAAFLHDIPEAAFELVAGALAAQGMRVNSIGSSICNASRSILNPFDGCRDSALRAAMRGRKLGAEFVRVMSYGIGDPEDLREAERFRRLREVVAIFAGSGVTVVHENCGNYGGMTWMHTLKLLENVPGLKLVFDMGNCVGDADYGKPEPHPRQNAWEFYRQVRGHIAYVHIKDANWDATNGKKIHGFPGKGEGFVREIVADLLASRYSGALSIEPHMHAGLPADLGLSEAENRYQTYVQYGRKLESLVKGVMA